MRVMAPAGQAGRGPCLMTSALALAALFVLLLAAAVTGVVSAGHLFDLYRFGSEAHFGVMLKEVYAVEGIPSGYAAQLGAGEEEVGGVDSGQGGGRAQDPHAEADLGADMEGLIGRE